MSERQDENLGRGEVRREQIQEIKEDGFVESQLYSGHKFNVEAGDQFIVVEKDGQRTKEKIIRKIKGRTWRIIEIKRAGDKSFSLQIDSGYTKKGPEVPRYSIIEKRNSENNQIIRREEQRRFYDQEGRETKREVNDISIEPMLIYFLGKPGRQETLIFKKGGQNDQDETIRGGIMRWEIEEAAVSESGKTRKTVFDFEDKKQLISQVSETGETKVEQEQDLLEARVDELKRFISSTKVQQIEKREKEIKTPKPEDYLQRV